MMNRGIYRKIAKKHGVSAEEVRQDIQNAIKITYSDTNQSLNNIKAQNAVPRKGEIPTPDELICHIVNEMHKKKT